MQGLGVGRAELLGQLQIRTNLQSQPCSPLPNPSRMLWSLRHTKVLFNQGPQLEDSFAYIFYYFLSMSVLPVCMSVRHAHARGGQKRSLDPPSCRWL